MKRTILILSSLLLLTGCWNNLELDDTALVHGVGLDKSDGQLEMSVEIIKPIGQGGGQSGGQSGGQGGNQGGEQHIVLTKKADTFLEGDRELVRYAKRRLDFGHCNVWIIGEKLSKEDFVHPIDIARRDQMFRLKSYLFVTNDEPSDILNTSTLYENLASVEIVSALEETQFVAAFTPIQVREFYKLIEGPTHSAYTPMISIKKEGKQVFTSIDRTAVIKGQHKVGELDTKETMGLNFLLNKVKGGDVEVSLDDKERVSLEISKATTKIKPQLKGNQLRVDIQTKLEGTLADNMTGNHINQHFFNEIESKISQQVEEDMQSTLEKLKELNTDITGIGLKTYQAYPKQWHKIRSDWGDIFADADITIDVDTNITTQGLINESVEPNYQRPHHNPYKFSK